MQFTIISCTAVIVMAFWMVTSKLDTQIRATQNLHEFLRVALSKQHFGEEETGFVIDYLRAISKGVQEVEGAAIRKRLDEVR